MSDSEKIQKILRMVTEMCINEARVRRVLDYSLVLVVAICAYSLLRCWQAHNYTASSPGAPAGAKFRLVPNRHGILPFMTVNHLVRLAFVDLLTSTKNAHVHILSTPVIFPYYLDLVSSCCTGT